MFSFFHDIYCCLFHGLSPPRNLGLQVGLNILRSRRGCLHRHQLYSPPISKGDWYTRRYWVSREVDCSSFSSSHLFSHTFIIRLSPVFCKERHWFCYGYSHSYSFNSILCLLNYSSNTWFLFIAGRIVGRRTYVLV